MLLSEGTNSPVEGNNLHITLPPSTSSGANANREMHYKEHLKDYNKKFITLSPTIRQRFEERDGVLVNTAVYQHASWLELLFDVAIIVASQKLALVKILYIIR